MPVAAHYLEIVDSNGLQILGESEGHDYEGYIDVTGWNWSVSDESAGKVGKRKDATTASLGAGSTKAAPTAKEVGISPTTVKFTKPVDSSTTRLMYSMYKGEELKMATFTLFEELVGVKDERRGAFRLHVVLEKVYVVGYQLSGSASDFRVDLDETWELNYSNIEFLYETERMKAEFDRNPGSTTRGPELSFLEQLKKYGIVPEPHRTKGKRE